LGVAIAASACAGEGAQQPPATADSAAADGAAAPAESESTLLQVAAAAGNFRTLAAAIQAAGLEETLSGPGPFTVFAPTDDAFAKLPPGTVDDLLKPENKAKLASVLAYHVVPGKLSAKEVVRSPTLKTVQGQSLAVKADGADVSIDNAKVVQADIMASNGVIHVIDTVVLPKG
jgi:uncharacterized surface protein with fasciclin (FAS1) repeats